MNATIYEFTANNPQGSNYTFQAYRFPNGSVLVPHSQTHDDFFDSLDSVEPNGMDTILGYEPTDSTVSFTEDELREAVRGSAREFGDDAIPESFRRYL